MTNYARALFLSNTTEKRVEFLGILILTVRLLCD